MILHYLFKVIAYILPVVGYAGKNTNDFIICFVLGLCSLSLSLFVFQKETKK